MARRVNEPGENDSFVLVEKFRTRRKERLFEVSVRQHVTNSGGIGRIGDEIEVSLKGFLRLLGTPQASVHDTQRPLALGPPRIQTNTLSQTRPSLVGVSFH